MRIKGEINSISYVITKIKTDKQTDKQGGQKKILRDEENIKFELHVFLR